MLKTAFHKHDVTDEETGKTSTVVTSHELYEVDAHSAVARFPHQWSFDENKFGQKLRPGEAPKSWATEKPAPVPIV